MTKSSSLGRTKAKRLACCLYYYDRVVLSSVSKLVPESTNLTPLSGTRLNLP